MATSTLWATWSTRCSSNRTTWTPRASWNGLRASERPSNAQYLRRLLKKWLTILSWGFIPLRSRRVFKKPILFDAWSCCGTRRTLGNRLDRAEQLVFSRSICAALWRADRISNYSKVDYSNRSNVKEKYQVAKLRSFINRRLTDALLLLYIPSQDYFSFVFAK